VKGVSLKIDRFAAFQKSIKSLTANKVLVGIPDENADRKPDPDDPAPITNAGIGYIMEKGAPEKNIPARPWLEPGVASAKAPITDRLHKTAMKALDGDVMATRAGLSGVGLIAQSAVRAKITEGPFAPLAPATLADRLRRGRTGEKPLIDTGQLRQAVNFVIRGN
jgi:hypothetical protein